MTKKQLTTYKKKLESLAQRVTSTTASLVEEVRTPTGGQGSGMESNAPMHLGDVGTDVYMQELNSAILENEVFIRNETLAALERIEKGEYGSCENCQQPIAKARLDELPYTRYCVQCAAQLQDGAQVNINIGRPTAWHPREGLGGSTGSEPLPQGSKDDLALMTRLARAEESEESADRHAVGTPGGGSAIGGLAGTTIGDGDPDSTGLENAMGSGRVEAEIESDEDEDIAYAGPSGGAIGGSPAGKRAVGGKKKKG